jgi:hypothetical protein
MVSGDAVWVLHSRNKRESARDSEPGSYCELFLILKADSQLPQRIVFILSSVISCENSEH